MNPFDLTGPQFLGFYAVLFVVVGAIAVWLRWLFRLPSDEPPAEALALPPYEVAYLVDGEMMAVNAAIARLFHADALAVDAPNRKLKRGIAGLPTTAPKLERVVFSAVKGSAGETFAAVRAAAKPALAPIKKRLQELGLVVADGPAWTARFVPLLLLLLVPLLGVVRIFNGMSHNRPVMYLVWLCVVSALMAFIVLGRSVHRSRRGDRAVAQLKDDNAALQHQASRRFDELPGDDLVLAVGLFGLGILAGSPLAELQTALKPPANSSSCGGGSCSSGSCGGGCGGGGCGGCGG